MLTTPSGALEDAGLPLADGASAATISIISQVLASAPYPAGSDSAAYAGLRRAVIEAGLLDRRYAYYLGRFLSAVGLVAGALALTLLVLPPGWGWTALAAIVIGFTTAQLGIIGHDAAHLAVFRRERPNWILGQFCLSLVLGLSFWFWRDRHNRHHVLTNDEGDDPDLELGGVFTLSTVEAAAQRGWRRFLTRYQAYLFIPILMLTLDISFRLDGWRFTLRELRGSRRITTVLLLTVSAALWASPALLLGWRWLAIYVGAQWLNNVYLGLIFAPNHKGMPTWTAGKKLSFLDRQVLSSCNVQSGPIADYMFNGLNYQIEHHLFPNMPRVNFARAQAIVRPFCEASGLGYVDLSPVDAFRQVVAELDRCGRAAQG